MSEQPPDINALRRLLKVGPDGAVVRTSVEVYRLAKPEDAACAAWRIVSVRSIAR